MRNFVVLLFSFMFLAGCTLPDDSPPPAQPPEISGSTHVVVTSPSIPENETSPQENSTVAPFEKNVTAENQTSTPPSENKTTVPSPPPNTQTDFPEDVVQKIEGSAILDSNKGRFSTKRCNIELSRSQIESGDTVSVKIYAYSPSNERVSFLCGESEKLQGYGGLFQDEILCDFETVGVTNVWLSLDNYICATAPLRVIDRDSRLDKFCSVVDYTNSDESTGVSRRFEASIYLTNYDADDVITWACGDENFEARIGELILAQEKTGYVRLSCDFPVDPGYIRSIPVYIGDDYCGDIIS